jgi:hypothetical protein
MGTGCRVVYRLAALVQPPDQWPILENEGLFTVQDMNKFEFLFNRSFPREYDRIESFLKIKNWTRYWDISGPDNEIVKWRKEQAKMISVD